MGVTTNYALRFPALTDAPDGATQIQNLADDVDAAIAAAVTGSIPVRLVTSGNQNGWTTSAMTVTDLVTPSLAAGKYHIRAMLTYQGAGSTGFPLFEVATPALSTYLATGIFQEAYGTYATTAGTLASGSPNFSGPPLAGGGNFFLYSFDMTATTSAAGAMIMKAWRSSGASDFTVHAGSWLEVVPTS